MSDSKPSLREQFKEVNRKFKDDMKSNNQRFKDTIELNKKPKVGVIPEKVKRFYKNIAIILLLIFLFPIGLFLMFKKSTWSKKSKIVVTSAGSVFVVLLMIAVVNAPPTATLDNIKFNNNKATEAENFNIIGSVFPSDALITVNGRVVKTDSQGKFTYVVPLHEGDNDIAVITKKDDKQSVAIYKLHRYTKEEIAKRLAVRIQNARDTQAAAELKAKQVVDKKTSDANKAEQQRIKREADNKIAATKAAAEAKAASDKKAAEAIRNQPKPQSTISKLWTALDNSLKTRDGMDIVWNDQTKIAELHYTNDSFWDEKDVVGTSYRQFVQWGKEVIKITEVETIQTNVSTNFTDSYGKNNTEIAVTIDMQSSDFKKYNWDNLKGQPIHNQLRSSDLGYLYISPAISKAVNLNDVKLYY